MLYSKGNETQEAYHSPECALLTHMQGRQTLPRFPWMEEICDCDQRPIFPVFCTNYGKPLVCHWGVRTVQSIMMTYPMLHTTMALSLNSSEVRTHSSESQLISQTSCVMPKQVNDGSSLSCVPSSPCIVASDCTGSRRTWFTHFLSFCAFVIPVRPQVWQRQWSFDLQARIKRSGGFSLMKFSFESEIIICLTMHYSIPLPWFHLHW